MQRPADAEKAFREALGLLDGLDRAAQKQPQVRFQMASCQKDLANALLKGGNSRQAEEGFRVAVQTYERLAAEFPMLPSPREGLASALNDLSRCLSWQGSYQKERDVVARWVEVTEKLAGDFRDVPFYRLELSRAYIERGRMEFQLGDRDESVRQRQKAIAVLTALVGEYPKRPSYRVELSTCHNGLAFAFVNMTRYADALAESARALETIRPLADPSAGVPDHQFRYAQCLINHGESLALNGKTEDALALAREAVAVLERLQGQTNNIEYRSYLGSAYLGLALRQLECGRPAAARPEADRAIATLEEVRRRDANLAQPRRVLRTVHEVRAQLLAGLDLDAAEVKHGQRALSLAHAGKFKEALKEAETLAKREDLSGEGCYNLARVYALLSQARKKDDAQNRDRDTARALELLRRARHSGYFNDAARRDRLRREPDLAPLHDWADFKELVAGGT
jgi:tetratricopeptide (TPR) repeat protein